VKGGRIIEGQREGRHHPAEDEYQGHHSQHREALQLERVPLVEAFQLVVLEAQRVERAAARRLHGMIHAVPPQLPLLSGSVRRLPKGLGPPRSGAASRGGGRSY